MQDLIPKLAKSARDDRLRAERRLLPPYPASNAIASTAKAASGPDISGVGNRFQPADLLEAILLPSKVISDQYQATEIITKDKQVFVGSVYEENDDRVVLRPSPLSTITEAVAKKDIE